MKLTRWNHGAFSTGGFVNGVVSNAHYFVLVFYSQVLGLEPELAALALGVGLVVDAVTDPLIGYLSDNTKSRLGRRHPYLYAAVFPLGAAYYFLWHPPEFVVAAGHLFTYLLVVILLLRFSMTLYVVPAYALVAEMTTDYEERTRLLSGMLSIGSIVGNGMSVVMYAFWLVPTDEYPDGVTNLLGYQEAGVVGAVMITIALLTFAVGLHPFARRSQRLATTSTISPGQFVRQVTDAINIPAMRAIVGAGVLYYGGVGAYAALWVYIYSFFWEFTSAQISLIVVPMVLGGLLFPLVLNRYSMGQEKRALAFYGLLGASLVNVLPIILRLLGLFPDNGTDVLFWIMLVLGFFETVLFLIFDACWASMTADLTEQVQLQTNRRNEGVISSGVAFASKCARALGTMFAGLALTVIAFPPGASVGEVPAETLFNLGLVYGPLILVFFVGAGFAVRKYDVLRGQHEDSVVKLAL